MEDHSFYKQLIFFTETTKFLSIWVCLPHTFSTHFVFTMLISAANFSTQVPQSLSRDFVHCFLQTAIKVVFFLASVISVGE